MKKLFFAIIFVFFSFDLYSQQLDITTDIGLGGGIEMASADSGTVWNASAFMTDIEIMFNTDNDPLFEAGFSIALPFTHRLGLGIIPKIKLKKELELFQVYGCIGGAVYIGSYTMIGVQTEFGVKKKFDYFSLFGEISPSFYPVGFLDLNNSSDIMSDDSGNGLLIQLNVIAGISFKF